MPRPKHVLLFITLVIIASGCTGEGPISISMKDPVISDFMSDHPGASFRVTHYSAADAVGIISRVREECGKESIQEKEFYLVNADSQGQTATAWVDWSVRTVECAFRTGSGQQAQCAAHSSFSCFGEDIYWFDSCGSKEDRKEECEYGCSGQACLQLACTPHVEYKCQNGSVYWFNSCGFAQEEKEHCNEGCANQTCIVTKLGCWDSDGGKDYYTFGIGNNFITEELQDHCNSRGNLVEIFCQEGQVWSEEYDCPGGCNDGRCLRNETYESQCKDSDAGLNYFESGETSGFIPSLETIPERDGELYALFVNSTSKAFLKLLGEMKEVTLGGTYNYTSSRVYIQQVNFYGINDSLNNVVIKTVAVKDHCLENYVSEYYCRDDKNYGTSLYDCPIECLNGACLKQQSS